MKRSLWLLLLSLPATPAPAGDIHELLCTTESGFAERMARDRDARIPLAEELENADEMARRMLRTLEGADEQRYSEADRATLTDRPLAWYSRKYRLVMRLIYTNPEYTGATPGHIAQLYLEQCLAHYRD
ncbi:hypothetical protein C7446_2987 [Kushneria sinocarnis]|uniref:Lysozyme inhibitor LprI N-terminal domain-containing protein n=1 Tax=Kushneria sinocarnis TaxID=595502 RepID=A0A420WTG7_9GAMM|nr:hypothetical protein [Kushneria sinocarnis]RKQ96386.1 hypothetical protein C7446_2987 [Kushneria sinocarnis]